MKTIKVDVAIMGSGLTGLTAGLKAQQAGLKVAIFEKRPFQGGGKSNCPVVLCASREDEAYQEAAFNNYMDHNSWSGNAALVRTFIKYSAKIPAFVSEELGVPFMAKFDTPIEAIGTAPAYGGCFPSALNIGDTYMISAIGMGHGATVICKKAADKIRAAGGDLYFNTPITSLIKEDDRIVGAYAKDLITGEEIRIEAKAVVVCCGGFINNPEMMQEQLGVKVTDKNASDGAQAVPITFSNAKMTGDGIKAIWDIGGAKGATWMGCGVNLPNPGPAGEHCTWLAPLQLMTLVEQPYLTVNKYGKRFISENASGCHQYKHNAFYQQPDKAGYIIFDDDVAERIATKGVEKTYFVFPSMKIPNIREQLQQAIDMGNTHVFIADSIEELCAQTGIDEQGLKETIARYNAACDAGHDDEFFVKPESLFPVRKPRFYAIKPVLSGYDTVGGVRVNGNCEVLDTAMRPIPGLYAGGDICKTEMFGDKPYNAVSEANFCFATGFAIAEQLIEKLK